MDCTPSQPQKPRCFSIFAVVGFVIFIALQSGYSEQVSALLEPARVTPAPAGAHLSTRPFSHLAVGVTAGTLGVGLEAATPLSRRTNLRVDGHFFNYSPTITQDGIDYTGDLRLRDFRASYDFFPFGGGFRLSGGVAMYNQFNVRAVASVPSGQTITLNNTDYFSSASNPLKGNASIAYGHTVAPTFTLGWGNVIPRSGRHMAFPVEIGAAFAGTPHFNLTVDPNSAACDAQGHCQPVATFAEFNSNKNAQIKKINDDIAPLRFYPILSAGLTYRF